MRAAIPTAIDPSNNAGIPPIPAEQAIRCGDCIISYYDIYAIGERDINSAGHLGQDERPKMHAHSESLAAPATVRAVWPVTQRHSALPMLPPRRSRIGNIFAEEIISCLVEPHPPTRREIEAVAARIWSEIQAGGRKVRWCDLEPDCRQRSRMIAAARAALCGSDSRGDRSPQGEAADAPACVPGSGPDRR